MNVLKMIFFACLFVPSVISTAHTAEKKTEEYSKIILADKPIAYWRFEETAGKPIINHATTAPLFNGTVNGVVKQHVDGASQKFFPLFTKQNYAAKIVEGKSFFRVKDSGKNLSLKFRKGDSITLEAWVNPQKREKISGTRYIIGKGRFGRKGIATHNQNYCMRLSYSNNSAKLNFLFRSEGHPGEWHRWTSKAAIAYSDGWHHVAITYQFGKKGSLRGYIDGKRVKGKWDFAGDTNKGPVVDNDDVWIGSSQGGSPTSTFYGALDEVAIYRKALSIKQLRTHYQFKSTPLPAVNIAAIPQGEILVHIFENIPDNRSWQRRSATLTDQFMKTSFAFVDIPRKYSNEGLRMNRSNPYLLRATGKVILPQGTHRILLRARNAAKLMMDGKQIVKTPFHDAFHGAHGKVFKVDTSLAPHIRPLHRGDNEKVVTMEGDGKEHVFEFQMIVGGQGRREDFGETAVCIATPTGDFQIFGHNSKVLLTDEGWKKFAAEQHAKLIPFNQQRRKAADTVGKKYWNKRHQLAKSLIGKMTPPNIPIVKKTTPVNNMIDKFIGKKLEDSQLKPAKLTSDGAFLRRVTLDIIGTVPTIQQIQTFQNDKKRGRRKRAIDRLLEHPGWADHWVSYWQDVLAENPNIIKPTLNNTGPFRFWIHESLLDNKPFDRFATELIMMRGSKYFGGPAGFAMASQNDAPMAAKAHIVSKAFLGLEMKCARCHDAPFRDFMQKDLFSLAAMLRKAPQEVPKTSTVPGGETATSSLVIEITLKPGEIIYPEWAFSQLIKKGQEKSLLRNPKDTREQAAALITSPLNKRFAKLIVNRMWKRAMGQGIAEPVDDWEDPTISHPELLDSLARELVLHNYDLKHIARLIFNSHAYQRVSVGKEILKEGEPYLFAAPIKRRMTAEQFVDSIFLIAEKPFDAGQITLDSDGAMKIGIGFNLGEPTRAWQFASLANERDRPSLALPFAQPFVSSLETFGWRSTRQNPITIREEATTALQPAVVANSLISRRMTRLSDDNAFTTLAMKEQSLPQLIEETFLRLLCRKPSLSERNLFEKLLKEGYQTRIVKNPPTRVKAKRLPREVVAWTNHLSKEANQIKIDLQKAVEEGDQPTHQLNANWRERMEDTIWALMNSPEFIFLP